MNYAQLVIAMPRTTMPGAVRHPSQEAINPPPALVRILVAIRRFAKQTLFAAG